MDNKKATLELGTKPVGKLLWQYALPAIVAMTASSLYNIIDRIFIGQVVAGLRAARLERKLTQENVRFDTDLNIARIESGRHSISLTTIADLCDYYKISPADLFRNIATHP